MLTPTIDLSSLPSATRNSSGYLQFCPSEVGSETGDDYACCQHTGADRVAGYMLPRLKAGQRVLDVGCGVGALVTALLERGLDAYGVDVPAVAPQWTKAGNDAGRFFSVNAVELPFPDNSFDVVTSFGVIEHIGTINGHCTLRDDYWDHRRAYAREILRVTRPGGRVFIACPNKSVPIDIQHGPTDAHSKAAPIRCYLFNKTGMTIHKTWGRYHLVSYGEVRDLFSGVRRFTPLSLKNYFGFGRFAGGFLKPFSAIAQSWIDNMPQFAATSFLNPYVMVEMTK